MNYFLLCALALRPLLLNPIPWPYKVLYAWVKTYRPSYDIVLVNKEEKLIGKSTEETPMLFHGLRIWTIKKSA